MGSLLSQSPLPKTIDIAKSAYNIYAAYFEKNYYKLLAKASIELVKEGKIASNITKYVIPIENARKLFTGVVGMEGYGQALETTSVLMARIHNGGGRLSTDLIGSNDTQAVYHPYDYK